MLGKIAYGKEGKVAHGKDDEATLDDAIHDKDGNVMLIVIHAKIRHGLPGGGII